jgi:soluble lytic murein transglycosylase-like protein
MGSLFAALVLAAGLSAAEEPKMAVQLAAVAAPGLDFARLGSLFDAARARLDAAGPPTAGRWAAPAKAAPAATAKAAKRRSPVVPAAGPPPAYRRTFKALLSRPDLTDRYDWIILENAARYRLDPRLLKAVIAAESEFFIRAVSPKGARGLMQVMPATAREVGVEPARLKEPRDNVQAGAAYLAKLFSAAWRRYKLKGLSYAQAPQWLMRRVLAAYNAGPRFLFHNRWYRQTKSYVRKVALFYASQVSALRRAPGALARYPKVVAALSRALN